MRLDHLATFIRIVKAGSITGAAQMLREPKSKVSRILSALESDLGAQLIYRSTRKMELTSEGKRLFEHSLSAIETLEASRDRLSEDKAVLSGKIKLTTPFDISVKILPEILTKFRSMHPQVLFELVLTQDIVDLIGNSVDLAIRFGKLKDSQLKAIKVFDEIMVLVAAPKFLEKNQRPKNLEDIANYPCLSFAETNGNWQLHQGSQQKLLKVNLHVSANDPTALFALVMMGAGIGYIPKMICRTELANGKLVQIFPDWTGRRFPVNIVSPYREKMPSRVREFANFLKTELKVYE